MTRFGPPLPSLKPNGRKASSTDSQKPHGKHTSAAAAGIRPRRMSLGNTFVSSSDFDFDEEFKKGLKEGSSRTQKKNAANSRRMSLAPMHETGRVSVNSNKENKERSLRRMSLQGACKRGSNGKESEVAAKDYFPSSEPVTKKEEMAKHKELVQHIDENNGGTGGSSVKHEDIVWRDGLLQQWDSLLDASSGFKSISVAYDEHRRKSDDLRTDLSLLPKVDTQILDCGEKTAALAAPESQSTVSEDLNEAITAEAEKPQIVCSCRGDTSRISESTPYCKGVKDIHMVEFRYEELQNSGSEKLKGFEADCDQLPASDKVGIELTPRKETPDAHSKCHHWASAAPTKFLYTAGILVAGAALLGCRYHRQVRSPL